MRVLVVEDDAVIASQIEAALVADGHSVVVASDGVAALDVAYPDAFALIVLDLMLPKKNGFEVCRILRTEGQTVPILMLTARDEIEDKVRGLEEGADDYLAKPFDVRELMARVRALLRRESSHRTGRIQIADLEIDTVGQQAYRQGTSLNLTPREFQLLEALARHEGRTLTRTWIMETVWGNEDLYENTVNFHVASLRRKVDQDYSPKLIQTVHGIGYMLKVPA
jgi:DNA-binding response OmpR family regulator